MPNMNLIIISCSLISFLIIIYLKECFFNRKNKKSTDNWHTGDVSSNFASHNNHYDAYDYRHNHHSLADDNADSGDSSYDGDSGGDGD